MKRITKPNKIKIRIQLFSITYYKIKFDISLKITTGLHLNVFSLNLFNTKVLYILIP